MKRRDFLAGSAVAGAALSAATALPRPAIAQSRMVWRMATSWPRGLPGLYTGAERFARAVEAASDGRLIIQVHGGDEIVPAFAVWQAVADGVVEMGHDASYYHMDKTRAAAFFTTVPFGMTPNEVNGWIQFGGGQAIWDEIYADFNLKPFPCGNTGVQMGGWFRHPIDSVDDLKGLKFRAPGLGGEMLRKLGVTTVLVPGGDAFQALQSGLIDAGEWTGPYNDLSMGLYKVAPYYYWPGIHEPGAALQLTINLDRWTSLPADLRQIIASCAIAENGVMAAEYQQRSGAALDRLVRDHGVKLRSFPRSVLAAFGTASGALVRDLLEDGDDHTRKAARSFLRNRKDMMRWTRVADQGFANARLLDFDYPEP
jgi:TRAP-type mannitol/chloroaromatic compound transport system substrate-binding protein